MTADENPVADADDFGWTFLASKGVVMPHLRRLVDELVSEFDADAAGFARLSRGSSDPRRLFECAVASAHIRQSLVSTFANLGSAWLHYEGFAERFPDTMIGLNREGSEEER